MHCVPALRHVFHSGQIAGEAPPFQDVLPAALTRFLLLTSILEILPLPWLTPQSMTPRLGKSNTKKIGDLTADELTGAVFDDRIKLPGAAEEATYISHYDLFNKLQNNAAAPASESMRAHNGVDLYKVEYSIKNKGQRDKVTGLLAVPVGIDTSSLPLYSYQHGTDFDANEGPSQIMKNDALQVRPAGAVFEGQSRSPETLFNLERFAGNGYAMVAADYNGLGDSTTRQYYVVRDPTTKATTGMIDAAKAILKNLSIQTTKLFLNGWSQGSVGTIWLQNELKNQNVPVEKAASSSTFSDLLGTANYWFNVFNGDPNWQSSCLPLVFGSYQKYYGIKGLMKKAIKPEYLKISKQIYNSKIDWDQVSGPQKEGEGLVGLPTTGREMLKDKFREQFNAGRGELYRRMQQNQILAEQYDHPTRFYGGGKDTVIPPGDSLQRPTEFLGPLSSAVLVGQDATHRSTFLGSLYGSALDPSNDIFTWFAQPQVG